MTHMPKNRLARAAGYWWRDLTQRKREHVRNERRVLRAVRHKRRWRDGYLAYSVTSLARLTGLPRGEVTRCLDVLVGRALVRGYAHSGRTVYLPRGRVPTGVLRGDGRATVDA